MSKLVKDWNDGHSAKFQKEIMTFKHALKETELFSDEALIRLLETHPQNSLDVCTMDPDHPIYPNKHRTGDFRDEHGNVNGKVLLDAAKAGKLWINVRQAMNLNPEYKALLDGMYGAIAGETNTKTYNANGGVLISSPIAKVPYHFDKTEVILWHVRGKKRIYLYPQTEKFIPDHAYEATMLTDLDDDLPYVEDFDKDAKIYDLEEGQAITWPLNTPHRVDNRDFCVSVTTEYSTRESGMKNSAMIANATMRHHFGINSSYREASTMTRKMKSVLGRVITKAGLAAKQQPDDMVTFKLDPRAQDYIADTEPYVRDF